MNPSNDNRGGRRRRRRRSNRRNDEPNTPNDPSLRIPSDRTVVIGITGEPGAGKSSLAKEFEPLGARILDVDRLGHQVLDDDATKGQLVERFGNDILAGDGSIDRGSLAAKAFADLDSVADLNRIVHPPLVKRTRDRLNQSGKLVIIDAALLNELGLDELCDQTVYVRAPREIRIERVGERGWDEGELTRREDALGDPDERRQACALTVDNSGESHLLGAYAKTILGRELGIDLLSMRKQVNGQGDEQDDNGDDEVLTPDDAEAVAPVRAQLNDYLDRKLPSLQEEAERLDVRDVRHQNKYDLVVEILKRVAGRREDDIVVEGFIEVVKETHGYIRSSLNGYLAVSTDTFISNQQLRRFGLKPGMHVTGLARAPRGNERCPQLLQITSVMKEPIEQLGRYTPFQHLTPLHATDRIFMELPNDPTDYSLRIIDLVAPIGKGQRGLIVSQPKAGKTVYLQKIAKAIATNNPEVKLMVLLVDERPEEVTDMERSVDGEVVASTFDQHASRHVQCAEIVIEKAKRLVERGEDVVILLDSITRLGRAYNAVAPNSGRIMSGGIDSNALVRPKQFFGAARNIEGGGSLTILATALVDTGSVMDTVIFEEFKGTGNMELVLDRRLANRRIFPAIDVAASGTRKDDLLITNPDEMRRVWALRKFLAERNPADAVEFLISKLKKFQTNIEFLLNIDPDRIHTW